MEFFPAVKVVLLREEFDGPYDETIVENLTRLYPGHIVLVRPNLERAWSKPAWDKKSDRAWEEYREEALEFLDHYENNKSIPLFRMTSEPWEGIISRVESEQEQHREYTAGLVQSKHKEYVSRPWNKTYTPEGTYWIRIPELMTGWRVQPTSINILNLGNRYGMTIDFGSVQGTGYSDIIDPSQTSCKLKFYVFGKKLLDDGRWTKIPGVWNGELTFHRSSFTNCYGWLELDNTAIFFQGLKTSIGQ